MKIQIIVRKYRTADGVDYKTGDIVEVGSEEGMAAISANVAIEPGKQPEPIPTAATSIPEPEPVEPVSKRERPPGKSSREE